MIALAKYWQLIVGGVGILILGILLAVAKGDARHWKKEAGQEKAAHAQTVTNYRLASAEATRLDAANKARAEAEQRAITERTVNDYETRIAAVRARFAGLRTGAAAADQGSRRDAPVPGASSTASHVDGAAAQSGFPPEDALIATEQALQLEALIAWVKGQAGVGN